TRRHPLILRSLATRQGGGELKATGPGPAKRGRLGQKTDYARFRGELLPLTLCPHLPFALCHLICSSQGCCPNLNVAPPSWRLFAGWKPTLHPRLGHYRPKKEVQNSNGKRQMANVSLVVRGTDCEDFNSTTYLVRASRYL